MISDRTERSYEATITLLLLLVTCAIGSALEYFRYLPVSIYLVLYTIAGFTFTFYRTTNGKD